MALNDVTFNRSQGGLGRPLPGNDYISGIIFYIAGTLPSGFTATDRIKKIFSVIDAENLGILDDHADETLGTGAQITVTGTWVIGEIVRIELEGATIGQFVLTATTITSLVAGLVLAINDETDTGISHGWVAVDADPIITLTQPDKLGITNETGTPLVFVDRNAGDTAASAGGTSTDVQPSSGVGSEQAYMHYNISEYFRMQPKGVLYVSINAQPTYDGAEIQTIQRFANGEIRQLGVYVSHETFAASLLTTTQADLDTMEDEHQPMSVVFHADFSAATLSTAANLTTLSNERVSMLIGEDGNWHQLAWSNAKAYQSGDKVVFQGASYTAKSVIASDTTNNPGPYDLTNWTLVDIALPTILGYSVSTVGNTLGTISFTAVHENIGWVEKMNLVSGTGLDEVAFAESTLLRDVAVSLRNQLDDYHYIFLRKHQGISGTFYNDSWTAIVATNDFTTIENVRTMDKAVRNIRTNTLSLLAGPIYFNDDGTISEDTIALFKNKSAKPLVDMIAEGELSGQQVIINPTQNTLATSKIVIGVELLTVGVGRDIQFDIGFVLKLS